MVLRVNEPPRSGTCTISPDRGTVSTEFTINCQNWYDSDSLNPNKELFGKILNLLSSTRTLLSLL